MCMSLFGQWTNLNFDLMKKLDEKSEDGHS